MAVAISVSDITTLARNFLKVNASYASAEEIRLANTVNSIISGYYHWHWNVTAGTDVTLSTTTQDNTIAAADQNKVLAIQNAYLKDGSTTLPNLLIQSDQTLPVTDTTGRPVAVSMLSPTAIRLWPLASSAFTFVWRFFKRPIVFTANTEAYDSPDAFLEVAKAGMIWQLMDYADDDRATRWSQTFFALLEGLKKREQMTNNRFRG